jgi:predicted DNA-binding transcriptional regulator YafY
MARSSNQKLKLLYIMDYLLQNTDPEHMVSTKQIIEYLEQQGVSAERKSVYDDIELLRLYGIDIEQESSGRYQRYYVSSRNFELPELKLLVDSVQSSKFITHKKTASLIRKIEKLASTYEAQLLQRQVYVTGRIKAMNESIYYNVDAIHVGITQDRKIKFKYFDYSVDKQRKYRKDGAFYVVSPFALTWDSANYYLVAFDSEAGFIKHYRVDKMTDISTIDEPRDGLKAYKELDMAAYGKKVFGMFSGDEETVQLRFTNNLVGAVLDRLGQDITIIPDGDEHFTVSAQVVVSPQFFAWVFGFAGGATVIGPQDVVERMREQCKTVSDQYE